MNAKFIIARIKSYEDHVVNDLVINMQIQIGGIKAGSSRCPIDLAERGKGHKGLPGNSKPRRPREIEATPDKKNGNAEASAEAGEPAPP